MFLAWVCLLLLGAIPGRADKETVSQLNPEKYEIAKDRRYLLYDVNPGEGANLRRDVHMRVANLVRHLREAGHNFLLVLPPWAGLYHWQTRELGPQNRIPWGLWFDLPSLNRFVPSIEFETFIQETGSKVVEHIYYLQHYREGWGDKGWQEKWDYRPCIETIPRHYQQDEDGRYLGWFWGYQDEVHALKLDCISIQGESKSLVPIVLQKNQTSRSIMIDRAETVLHDFFGDVYYWKARQSMRYSKELRDIGDEFRRKELDSTDEKDGTVLDEDWTKTKVIPGQAEGGPYLAVHWRRKDFVRAHGKELPSIPGTARQISKLLQKLDLKTVFLATDAKAEEVEELRLLLAEGRALKQFLPSKEVLHQYKDGGVAIVDQWICAHARYFSGSYVSTFSFRIQDEREILGFASDSTFHRLCPDDNPDDCEQPAKWTLVQ